MRWRGGLGVVVLATLASACGSTASPAPPAPAAIAAGVPATSGALVGSTDSTVYSAPHPSLPIIDYNGGPILTAPEIVVMTFDGDPLASEIDAFSDAVGGTDWWKTVTRGYCAPSGGPCVGAISHAASIVIPALDHDTALSGFDDSGDQDSSLKQLIRRQIESGLAPRPNANTVYTVFLPENVPIRDYDAYRGCHDFLAYHSSMQLDDPAADGGAGDDMIVPYVLMARCQPEAFGDLSRAFSHELLEVAVDPDVDDHGFFLKDTVWPAFFGGNEPADLCADVFGQDDTVVENGMTLQRIWSNAAVAEGTDPCVPAPEGEVYFNSAPPTDLVRMEVGETVQIEIDGFSQGPIGDWTIEALDLFDAEGIGRFLNLSVDDVNVNNGTRRMLTIQMLQAGPPGSPVGAPILLRSKLGSGHTHLWPIAVIGTH